MKASKTSLHTMYPTGTENEKIDQIIRGEISAMKAYEQVMEKIDDDPEEYRLKQFKLDHENAVQFWKKEERMSGKITESDSSIWGTAVEAFVGTSKLVGEKTALKALKKGEEYGLSLYEDLLNSDGLTTIQRAEIKETFIPRQKRHIESINALIKMQ